MRKERKKHLTTGELKAAGVSREVVVRKVRRIPHSPGPIVPSHHGPGQNGKRGVLSVDLSDVGDIERRAAVTACRADRGAQDSRGRGVVAIG